MFNTTCTIKLKHRDSHKTPVTPKKRPYSVPTALNKMESAELLQFLHDFKHFNNCSIL